MRTILNTVVMRITLLIGCAGVVSGAVITNQPTGDGLWSTPGNWIGGVAPANGDSVLLIEDNGYAPTTVDIANLALDYLFFSNVTAGITLTGNDFLFNTIVCLSRGAPRMTNTIEQNIKMTRMAPSVDNPTFGIANNSALRLNGVLGVTNPACGLYYTFRPWLGGNANGIALLMNTNTFAKGIDGLYTRLTFFNDAALGAVPPTNVPGYIEYINEARLVPSSTGGYNRVTIHENRGLTVSGNSRLVTEGDVKIVHRGTLTYVSGTMHFFDNDNANNLIVLSGSNAYAGPVTVNGSGKNNVLVMDHPAAFGTSYLTNELNVGSAFDFNGHDLLTLRPYTVNNGGFFGSGVFRNNNPGTAATIGRDAGFAGPSAILFGGRGDIVVAGDLRNRGGLGGTLRKAGTGTVTLQGATRATNDVSVRAGTLVCDYRNSSEPKLTLTNHFLNVRGATVRFVGSDTTPVTENITELNGTESGVAQGAAALEINAGANQDFTLAAERLRLSQGDSLDISLSDNGSGVAAFTNAFASLNDGKTNFGGALGGNVTFNRRTWATVVNGNVQGLPDDDFTTDLDSAAPTSHVDITGVINVDSVNANTLRAKSPGATTLTIASGKTLLFPFAGSDKLAGVLLTPEAGDVTIEGGTIDFGANHWLHLHNYSSNRFTISSLITLHTVNSHVMTCGPGEINLLNPNNTFKNLAVYGGTMMFDQIADTGAPQELGTGQLYLGDATLKYTGAGHSSDRTIILRGSGVIDASGTGPLTFTTTKNFIVSPANDLRDMPLTLTGTGTGSIAGTMATLAGYLTKRGSGVWVLGNGCTNWQTTIEDGTLCVNGTLHSWNVVNVGSNGRLTGTGVIPRDLEISGAVAPGLSVGTLNAGFVTFNPGAVYEWELGNEGTSDVIRATGDIEVGAVANSITVMVSKVEGTSQQGAYRLLNGGAIIGVTNAIVMQYSQGLIGPAHPTFDGGNATVTVVPEPSVMLLVTLAVLGLRRAARPAC